MKYVVVLSDGMAGRPLSELDGKTTLEAAETPVMDELAPVSELGMASMVPEGMAPGSDTANLSVMGYDPRIYYTGRSPLEALSIGVEMEETRRLFPLQSGDAVGRRCSLRGPRRSWTIVRTRSQQRMRRSF